MSSYHIEHHIHADDSPAIAWPARNDHKGSPTKGVRKNSLPRIAVIEDGMDVPIDDSYYETEDEQDSFDDSESDDEENSLPSVGQPPTSRTNSLDARSSRYATSALELQSFQQDPLAQRRMTIADNQSVEFVSADVPQNNYGASRRSSAPSIDSRNMPSDQGPSVQPPAPKPSKPPLNLKLYPWLTQKESPPPRYTPGGMIKCPYPTNDCTEILPRNMLTWRRHLGKKHGLVKDGISQTCQWPGCGMTMGGRSLNRHVLMNHMDFKPSCPHCKVRRRYDHLEKHISNCSLNPAREVNVKN